MNKSRSKIWKLVLSVTLGVLGVLLIIVAYLSLQYPILIKNKLRAELPQAISFDFASMRIDLLNRSAKVGGLTIRYQPDSLSDYHYLRFTEVEIRGIDLLSLLRKREFESKEIRIRGSAIRLDKTLFNKDQPRGYIKNGNPAPASTAMGQIKLHVNSLVVEKLAFVLNRTDGEEFACELNLHAENLAMIASNDGLTNPFHHIDLKSIEITDMKYAPEDNLYTYSVSNLSYQNETLRARSLSMQPAYSKFRFAHHAGKQIDRVDLIVDSLNLSGLEIKSVLDSVVDVRSALVGGAKLHVFRDKRVPMEGGEDKPLPITQFRNLPFQISIDTLRVENTDIYYEEFPERGGESGTVSFNQVRALLTSASNRERTFNRYMALDVHAVFMNKALLNSRFLFPCNPANIYYAEGDLTGLDLTSLNGAVEPLGRMRISSGRLNSLFFNFDYNQSESKGTLLITYEDLKIESLDKKSGNTVSGLKSLLLNLIIPNEKNDETILEKRTGKINFIRDPQKSVFNYWWKSLQDGLTSALNLKVADPQKKP